MNDMRNNDGLPFDEDDDGGIAHGTGEGWGSPEDLAAVVDHVQSIPPGVNSWGLEDGLVETLPRAASVADVLNYSDYVEKMAARPPAHPDRS